MKTYITKLVLSDGTELLWHWEADDAMHAMEQLMNDPPLFNAHTVVSVTAYAKD